MGGSAHVARIPASFTIADVVWSETSFTWEPQQDSIASVGLFRRPVQQHIERQVTNPSSTDRKRRQSSFAGLANRHRTPSNQPTSVARESRSHCPPRSACEKITRDPCRSQRRQRQDTLGRPLNWHSADNWQRPSRASPLSTHHCNNHESLLTSCSGRGDLLLLLLLNGYIILKE